MKKNITTKKVAILYTICMVCWMVNTTIYFYQQEWSKGFMDLCVTIMWGILSVAYWRKVKEEQK